MRHTGFRDIICIRKNQNPVNKENDADMKKVLAMVLAFCLLCGSTSAFAVTYTMPEKLSRQLVIGSGLKGSFVLNAEGSSGAAAVLSVLNGAEIQVRGMASDENWHYYFYQTDENENQWARTDLQRKDGNVYLRSDLLKEDRILMLPAVENALDTLTRGSEGTPSFASAVWRLFRMSDGTREDIWNPMVALLGERLENWLTPYAQEPAVKQTDDGQAVIEMGYVIPAEDLKQGILDGLELVTGNQELMTLAADMTTEEQQETYLNPYLRYFYQQALDQLILPFDVSLSRTVSTLGSTLSSVIELPLDEEKT